MVKKLSTQLADLIQRIETAKAECEQRSTSSMGFTRMHYDMAIADLVRAREAVRAAIEEVSNA